MDFKTQKRTKGRVIMTKELLPLEIKLLDAGERLCELYNDILELKNKAILSTNNNPRLFNNLFYRCVEIQEKQEKKDAITKIKARYETILGTIKDTYEKGCEILDQDNRLSDTKKEEGRLYFTFTRDPKDIQNLSDNFNDIYYQTYNLAKVCNSILNDEQHSENDEQ